MVGPYTLAENAAYYGESSWWHDANPREMAKEAVILASQDVDYSEFDYDGDGVVDFVHIIYAGTSETQSGNSDDIWPHSWSFDADTILNGMSFHGYSCSNERSPTGHIHGIGTACHEIGHDLGLPDYYDTDYYDNGGLAHTLGTWDLMDAGSYNNNSNTPPTINAYSAYRLGWMDLPELEEGDYTMHAFADSAQAYRITLTDNEFFVFEYRKRTKWDIYTRGDGLLVFHGDNRLIEPWFESRANTINVDPNDRGFFFETSTGNSFDVNSNLLPFSNFTSPAFTDLTASKTKLKDGTIVNTPLTYIRFEDSLLCFSYKSSLGQIINKGHNIYSIDSFQADVKGNIAHWGEGLLEKGFIWNVDSCNLSYDLSPKNIDTTDSHDFTTTLTELPGYSTRIYYKPYLQYSDTVIYGAMRTLVSQGEVGLEAIAIEPSIKIYPNPAESYIWIESPSGISYEILDMMGNRVIDNRKTNGERTRLDLSQLRAGAYIIHFYSKDLNVRKKIIIR